MNINTHEMKINNNLTNTYQDTQIQESVQIANTQNSSLKVQQRQIEKSQETQAVEERKQQLNELAQQLNKELSPLNTNISFGFNEDIKGMYVSVTEKNTNRLIRKIPSDEAMELMAKMREIVGIIFNKEV
ncbi:MAG: flagellar protein FlaG [Helicobacter sp.]|nr:flagellar protein FlaG [Helicobacter sp.]